MLCALLPFYLMLFVLFFILPSLRKVSCPEKRAKTYCSHKRAWECTLLSFQNLQTFSPLPTGKAQTLSKVEWSTALSELYQCARLKKTKHQPPLTFCALEMGSGGRWWWGGGGGIGTGRLWTVQKKRRRQGKPSPVSVVAQLWTLSTRPILS